MFQAATGLNYHDFLQALHRQMRFDWYLEVGSQTGRSLVLSHSRSIAVDPAFRIKYNVAANKPLLHLYQATSDDFFAAGHLKALKAKPDFSFLDGMHLFEYLLRDFINTEAAGKTTSVIALHDCCPFGLGMTTRDLDNLPRGAWTGDVWKLIPILQEYRPDLTIQVLDCAPTGLVVVSGLKPQNQVLKKSYDAIVARYVPLTLDAFGIDRFYASFAYVDARAFAMAGFPAFRPACKTFIAEATPDFSTPPATVAPAIPAPGAPVEPATDQASPPAPALARTSVHGIDLYTGHRVHRDMAADLAQCLTRPLPRAADVVVGVNAVPVPPDTGRFRIGIQTEQYFDRNGQKMWRMPRPRFIARFVRNFDLVLDLSPDNARAYDFLPADLRAKVHFGPHIFPETPIEPTKLDGPPLFFGSINDRRRGLLDALTASRGIVVAPHGTFGKGLNKLLQTHGSVINLHYRDGEYCEYPRLLKAYLNGKPLLSETMSPPLIQKTHYFDLATRPTEAATRRLFKNLAAFAARHSFQGFLEAATTGTLAPAAG